MKKGDITIYIIIIVALVTAIICAIDMLNINKCSMCGDTTIGKQEAIKDKPVCERCFSEWEYQKGVK